MNYGKGPGNPVILSSRAAVKRFLDHLVTDQGFHLLYHWCGSVSGNNEDNIDYFEIFTGGGEYDDLFFNLHNRSDIWIPPAGYLFVPEIELKPLGIPEYDRCYTAEKEITVERKYIFRDADTGDWEENMRFFQGLPRLERYLYYSSGEDGYTENFPFPLIDEILDNLDIEISHVMKDWIISPIKPRENRPLFSGKS
jgi:hypothetical protein